MKKRWEKKRDRGRNGIRIKIREVEEQGMEVIDEGMN